MGEHLTDTILLTGIPRSGTTLCCNLLGQCENTLALHEPINPRVFDAETDRDAACRKISEFLIATRKMAIERNAVPSKHIDGTIPTNPVVAERLSNGLRREVVELGMVDVDKSLTNDFTLVVKHNALFTSLLDQLMHDFRCFAVIRNPLAVLASWASVDLPVNQGRIPMGERFDSALATSLDSTPDTIDRQFSILGWFYSRYAKRLSDSTILRYEDIVETNGQCLDCLLSRPVRLSVDLENLNEKTGIDKSLLLSLHGKLIENCALFEQFYTKDEVDRLLDRYLIK